LARRQLRMRRRQDKLRDTDDGSNAVETSAPQTRAVRNKAQVWVFGACGLSGPRWPLPLVGLDFANGSEFINQPFRRSLPRRSPAC